MTKPQKMRPVLLDRPTLNRRPFDCRGVSPVIAVILMVAITVVLAAVLYTMVILLIQQPDVGEIGSVRFEEYEDTPGKYRGTYQGSIKLESIEIMVFDISEDDTLLFYPAVESYKEIPGGLNFTYKDTNENGKLDGADLLILDGGETGDEVNIVGERTGKIIATHTLT